MNRDGIEQDITIYDKSNLYEFDNSIMMHYYPERIIEVWEQNSGDKKANCLELGVGHGYSAEVFSNYFDKYTVLDGDKSIIDRFKKTHANLTINMIETYFEDFDTNEKYDIIILGFVLEHVDEPEVILNKYKEMLSENGKIFITVPNAEALNRRIGKAAGILDELGVLSEHDVRCGHKRYYTTKIMEKEIENANLKIVMKEGLFLKPITTSQMLSLNFSDDIIRGMLEVGKDYPELCLGLLYEVEQ